MTDRYLRTGIFLAPFHALDENPTLAIERDMELVQHLDRLNYHEAWIGEHHSGGFEIIASPEMFIAAAAERTQHIRLGTGVVSLPYHNPFMLASRMTQLDHMTRGRAMFGVGPGALVHDAAKIGIKAADQRSRMNESLDVIVDLMAGKSVTRKTDWFDLTAAQLQLAVLQPARHGDGGRLRALAGRRRRLGPPRHRHAVDRRHLGRRAEGARRQLEASTPTTPGRTARWPTAPSGASSPSPTSRQTREQAFEEVKFGLDRFAKYFTDVATFPILPPGITDAAEFLTKEGVACIGTPDDCIRHFERLWKGSDGGFGAVLLLAHNWADWPATQRSYELMARFVHPHFQRGSNALRQLSYDIAAGNRGTYSVQSQAAVQGEIDKYAAAKSKRAAE